MTFWGCPGFDEDEEGLSACQGWSSGLVKRRPKLTGEENFAIAA